MHVLSPSLPTYAAFPTAPDSQGRPCTQSQPFLKFLHQESSPHSLTMFLWASCASTWDVGTKLGCRLQGKAWRNTVPDVTSQSVLQALEFLLCKAQTLLTKNMFFRKLVFYDIKIQSSYFSWQALPTGNQPCVKNIGLSSHLNLSSPTQMFIPFSQTRWVTFSKHSFILLVYTFF